MHSAQAVLQSGEGSMRELGPHWYHCNCLPQVWYMPLVLGVLAVQQMYALLLSMLVLFKGP